MVTTPIETGKNLTVMGKREMGLKRNDEEINKRLKSHKNNNFILSNINQ